ncbi:HAD-IC family P-type ATPase [Sphingomonas sp. dw_22]|uniref:HAD-IC family P-type ATPase n=1 Tax=Sphingomonas sp. dw_22 TaxID=2721175 RepID=UPI0031FEC282
MDHASGKPWHSESEERVLAMLDASRTGFTPEEAAQRLARYGPNALPGATRHHPVLRFLKQFRSALIYFLLAGAAAAMLLGHGIDAAVILVVVLVNAIVGFAQEGKAEQALDAIRDMIAPHAVALRDGVRTQVAVRDLVPGDIVLLEAGDRVPADLRLLRARGLLIDEAALTGESVASEKNEAVVPAEASLGDRSNMAFSGTLVAAGQATGLVVATGTATEIGRISRLLQSVEMLTTPLLRQIERFARRFTAIVLIGSVALFAFAVLARGFVWDEALIAVVALAVGVIPEGLPAVITITLAIGVRRMASRNAVIRKLPAVETLGATSVICSDKTGTLTRNEMTARQVVTTAHRLMVGGSGYRPEGEIIAEGTDDDAEALAAAMPVLRCGLLCNDAHLRESAGQWHVDGDPMEGALVALAMKAKLDPADVRAEWPRIDEIPFDAAHRFMASLHRSPTGEAFAFVKGAPEALFGMAAAPDLDFWNARIAEAAGEGERVLAFGMKRLPAGTEHLGFADVAGGVELLGIIGFIDPPRPEATAAIAECRSAGIEVKMITGDHVTTALAIARQLGLADDPQAITGAELDGLSDAELAVLVRRVSVFARTSPEHKLRIVRALQADGAIVAMTGDGVNDAPSLKQADVGTAMGRKGTEAAKEAAEMVLLDDNFASIVSAVHEGRTVYDNIRKVTSWTIPTNGGETLVVVLAIFAGFALPMTATQILWVNLILEGTLGLALAFEPSEPGVMRRRPRRPDAPLLSSFLLWRVVLVSVLLAGAALGVFFYALDAGRDIATARTMVVNMLVVGEIFYLFNVRYLHKGSISWRGALGTPAVLAAIGVVVAGQLAFTYAPFMNEIFASRPLSLADGALIVGIGIALMVLLEGEKLLMRRIGWFEELSE